MLLGLCLCLCLWWWWWWWWWCRECLKTMKNRENNNKYMNFFIIVDIIFYCDVYVILLR